MRSPATTSVLLTLAACSSQPDEVDLSQIAADLDYWDGRTVMIDAWLATCGGENCFVVPTKSDLAATLTCSEADCADGRVGSESLVVSLGYDADFDERALPLVGKRVLLEGTIDATSWRIPDIGRGDAIQPLSIQPHPEQTES